MEQQELFARDTQAKMEQFLSSWVSIEEEQDRLREQQRLLREEYADYFSIRALTTAVKVVRAKRKLADHPKEPVPLLYQVRYEDLVTQWLTHLEEERETLTADAARLAHRPVPDMTTQGD